MMPTEIPLTGGRITAGVVRIDDTVRRPLSQNSAFVHSLLQHLEARQFNASPRFLGIDAASREILSYLEGTVPKELAEYSDNQLQAAAQLIRRYHDATIELAQRQGAEVICHNDLSPCNFVFSENLPCAIIDFDAVAPGSRVADLSYAAWMWLDIGNQNIEPEEQKRKLRLFCQTYGQPFGQSFVEAMLQRQILLIESGQKRSDLEMSAWAKSCYEWTKHYLTDSEE